MESIWTDGWETPKHNNNKTRNENKHTHVGLKNFTQDRRTHSGCGGSSYWRSTCPSQLAAGDSGSSPKLSSLGQPDGSGAPERSGGASSLLSALVLAALALRMGSCTCSNTSTFSAVDLSLQHHSTTMSLNHSTLALAMCIGL